MSRRKYSFMLTSSKIYGCKNCGQWQRISGWDWVALLACKLHERKCEAAAPHMLTEVADEYVRNFPARSTDPVVTWLKNRTNPYRSQA